KWPPEKPGRFSIPKMYSLNSEASILPRRMSAALKRWRSSWGRVNGTGYLPDLVMACLPESAASGGLHIRRWGCASPCASGGAGASLRALVADDRNRMRPVSGQAALVMVVVPQPRLAALRAGQPRLHSPTPADRAPHAPAAAGASPARGTPAHPPA